MSSNEWTLIECVDLLDSVQHANVLIETAIERLGHIPVEEYEDPRKQVDEALFILGLFRDQGVSEVLKRVREKINIYVKRQGFLNESDSF